MTAARPDTLRKKPADLGRHDIHVWYGRHEQGRITGNVLSRYLGLPANELKFATGSNGKPGLAGEDLQFSKSTSRNRTTIAVTRDMPVGVDVELVRPVCDVVGLATKAFGAEAAIAIGALPMESRSRTFLQAWTRLEAVIKANGASIGRDASRYRIVWSPDQEPAVLSIDRDRHAGMMYTLRDLDLGPDHVGSVAVKGQIDSIECRQI